MFGEQSNADETNPLPRGTTVLSYVIVTFLVSWGLWIPAGLLDPPGGVRSVMAILGSFGPAIAGGVMTRSTGGSLGGWIADMARWRVAPRWYLAAFGVPLSFALVETATYAVFAGQIDLTTVPFRMVVWISSFVAALLVLGGNEELGWRGYMQPQLQHSYGAFTAALVVGVVWTVWHFPLDLLVVAGDVTDPGWLLTRAYTIPLAVVYAWLYNSTNGSVVVTMVFHAGWNSGSVLVPASISEGIGSGAGTLAMSYDPVSTGTRLIGIVLLVLVLVFIYRTETLASRDVPTRTAA